MAGIGPPERLLCRLSEIPDGGSRGFPGPPGCFTGLFAVRTGASVRVYVNACPHLGTPLDFLPDRFLTLDGKRIICATHGAEFRIEDGVCLSGPCEGERLEAEPVEIRDGAVLVSPEAGR